MLPLPLLPLPPASGSHHSHQPLRLAGRAGGSRSAILLAPFAGGVDGVGAEVDVAEGHVRVNSEIVAAAAAAAAGAAEEVNDFVADSGGNVVDADVADYEGGARVANCVGIAVDSENGVVVVVGVAAAAATAAVDVDDDVDTSLVTKQTMTHGC